MKTISLLFTFILGLLLSCQFLHAQSVTVAKATDAFDSATDLKALLEALATVEPVAFDSLPKNRRGDVFATGYWSMKNPNWPPLPANFYGLDVWPIGGNLYVIDDRKIDYDAIEASTKSGSRQARTAFSSSGGGYAPNLLFATNVLWLEITNVDLAGQFADLLVHNTSDTLFYQLATKTNLLQPEWKVRAVQAGESGTNVTPFHGENIGNNPTLFFRAQAAGWRVSVSAGGPAIEPHGSNPGLAGIFNVNGNDASGTANHLTVYYRLGGMAVADIDYTNLPGVLNFTNGSGTVQIFVNPIADNLLEGVESVSLTLIPTNTYLVELNQGSATNEIRDSGSTVHLTATEPAAVEPDGPPGVAAQNGVFKFTRDEYFSGGTNALLVKYVVSGTANNGVDYTNLPGTITFAPGDFETNLLVKPAKDLLPEGVETVTLTLVPTNTYLLDNDSADTVNISDSSTTVNITGDQTAAEPGPNTNTIPGQTAFFTLSRSDTRGILANLLVRYTLGGTASNGVDYAALSGTVMFAPGDTSTNIYMQPLPDYLPFEGTETVVLTLQNTGTNGYLIGDPPAATNYITDTGMVFENVTNASVPVGMDYYAPSNYLIVSSQTSGGLLRVYTNVVMSNSVAVATNLIVTNWSGISGLTEEVKLATVKTTANGFTSGEVFFGNNLAAKIGWLSADGTVSNLTFATLTNDTWIRGGLYIDQSGNFNGDLIAVTGNVQVGVNAGGGVWRVKSSGVASRLANITNTHLEGVITLTNDPARWGPWAGKIITGAEGSTPPMVITVSTNGTVQTFLFGIGPEDFDIIPTNQDLYLAVATAPNRIDKVSRRYFEPYIGDLLITQSGDGLTSPDRKLFIVHWDSGTTNFIIQNIPTERILEHVTFAPINLPSH